MLTSSANIALGQGMHATLTSLKFVPLHMFNLSSRWYVRATFSDEPIQCMDFIFLDSFVYLPSVFVKDSKLFVLMYGHLLQQTTALPKRQSFHLLAVQLFGRFLVLLQLNNNISALAQAVVVFPSSSSLWVLRCLSNLLSRRNLCQQASRYNTIRLKWDEVNLPPSCPTQRVPIHKAHPQRSFHPTSAFPR